MGPKYPVLLLSLNVHERFSIKLFNTPQLYEIICESKIGYPFVINKLNTPKSTIVLSIPTIENLINSKKVWFFIFSLLLTNLLISPIVIRIQGKYLFVLKIVIKQIVSYNKSEYYYFFKRRDYYLSRLSGYINGWLSHRHALLELLKVVNDEQLSFRPWEKGMSLSEMALHIIGANTMFVNSLKTGVITRPTEKKEVTSAKELIEVIEAQTEYAKQVLETLSEEQLKSIITFAGMDLPGTAILELAKDHEIHHKGQLFTYVRLLGIEQVPFFIYRP
jgi:uncharacterized damage-inducible protein DinB